MQLLRLKTLPVIFVAVQDLTLIVSVKTSQRCKALGFEGMHFKWDRDRQKWYGPISLKNLEALDRWPEAELSTEARQALGVFREAERRLREVVLEDPSYSLRWATYFYIIDEIRGPKMPRKRWSWLSTVPWVASGVEAARGLWREARSGCASAVGNISPRSSSRSMTFNTNWLNAIELLEMHAKNL